MHAKCFQSLFFFRSLLINCQIGSMRGFTISGANLSQHTVLDQSNTHTDETCIHTLNVWESLPVGLKSNPLHCIFLIYIYIQTGCDKDET